MCIYVYVCVYIYIYIRFFLLIHVLKYMLPPPQENLPFQVILDLGWV